MQELTPEEKAEVRRLMDARMDAYTGAIAESPTISREQKEEIYRILAKVRSQHRIDREARRKQR